MAELSQEEKFKKAFRDLTKDEIAFNNKGNNEIAFTNSKVMPIIPNKNLFVTKSQR